MRARRALGLALPTGALVLLGAWLLLRQPPGPEPAAAPEPGGATVSAEATPVAAQPPPSPTRSALAAGADAGDPGVALADLNARSQGAVRRSPIPVRVFPDLGRDDLISAGPTWYAVASRRGGVQRTLHAIQDATGAGEEAAARHRESPDGYVAGHPAVATHVHGILTVSWIEEGVGYALDVECGAHPRDDDRCAEPEYAISLANSMVPVSP